MTRRLPRFDKNLLDCQYQAALKAADMHFNNLEMSKTWLECENPLLGNVSPKAMLNIGRFDKLMSFIYTQLRENHV
jgi:hypothetical protein